MTRKRQGGAVIVLVVVGLVALLAMAGLAIDMGHLGHNKARLQSTVDAAALAAAKVLDQTERRGSSQRSQPHSACSASTPPLIPSSIKSWATGSRSRCSTRIR